MWQDNSAFVVLDEAAGKSYTSVTEPVWNPDGNHLFYFARHNKENAQGKKEGKPDWEAVLVQDSVEIHVFDYISDLAFSSDGKHFAFKAWKGGKSVVVVDGKEDEAFSIIPRGGGPHFIDSTTMRYLAFDNCQDAEKSQATSSACKVYLVEHRF